MHHGAAAVLRRAGLRGHPERRRHGPLPAAAGRRAAPARAAADLFVGRFDPRNGLGTLLGAARILRDQGREFTVQVVGDGAARARYHRMARELCVEDRVEWLGTRDRDRPRIYREADVFAAPCVLASFGVVLLEALASGTPLVCADNVGFRQVIRDGMPGRLHAPHDPADLAAGIAELLDDAALPADRAARGRRLTEERYAWGGVADRVAAVYDEVYARSGGRPRATPPVGLRYNLRRNPRELMRNIPSAVRAGWPRRDAADPLEEA